MSIEVKKTLWLLMSLVGCLWAKPIVSVSIPPQTYFLQKIGGDTVDVRVMLPPHADEHSFEFKPSDMVTLEKSDLYFMVGLEFEKILISKFKSNFPHLIFVDTNALIPQESFISNDQEHAHHDHDRSFHDSQSSDPHVWLDPILVKYQARSIAQALSDRYPEHKALYAKNLATFEVELQALDEKIQALLAKISDRKFLIYHPSWGYFARRYHLEQLSVEVDGKEPKIKDLQRLITTIKSDHIRTIFIRLGTSPRSVDMLAHELSLEIVYVDHLSDDWAHELLKIPLALQPKSPATHP